MEKKDTPMLDLLKHYESIELTIKSLEKQRETIGATIIEEFRRQGATKSQRLEYGVISLIKRKSWKFSSRVKQAEQIVKDTKEAEKKAGTATYAVSEYLTYKEEKKPKK